MSGAVVKATTLLAAADNCGGAFLSAHRESVHGIHMIAGAESSNKNLQQFSFCESG
jgi:hypothetical protein